MTSVFRVQYAASDAEVFHTQRDCPVGRAIPAAVRVSGGDAGSGRVQCDTCDAMSDLRVDSEAIRHRPGPRRRP